MKTIQIKEKNWKKISQLRLKYNFKTMDDTIKVLLDLEKDFKPELKEMTK